MYSLKACAIASVVKQQTACVDGFSCSSLFEARLAREIGGGGTVVGYVSPIPRSTELEEITSICDRITLNSVSQFFRHASRFRPQCDIGIRLNPGISFAG